MYSAKADILEQIENESLIELTDDLDVGDSVESIITRAIIDADAEINSYLGGRYSVPLSPVPALIRKYSVDIAIYNLHSRRGGSPENRLQRYNNAIKFLQGIASGVNTLGEADPETGNESVSFNYNTRIFTRETMRDF